MTASAKATKRAKNTQTTVVAAVQTRLNVDAATLQRESHDQKTPQWLQEMNESERKAVFCDFIE